MLDIKELLAKIALKLTTWLNEATHNSFDGFVATAKISFWLTPFVFIWEKISMWGITNQDYILIVLGAIFIDWLFGTIKHLWFTYTFSWKGNAIGLVTKIALAVAGGFLFEGLNYLVSESDTAVLIMKIITRVIVFMYPAISAFENIYIVSGEKFPPKAWMERLKLWNETLNPNDLKGKNKNKDKDD